MFLTKAYLWHVIISVSALGIKTYYFLHIEPELTWSKERQVECLMEVCAVLGAVTLPSSLILLYTGKYSPRLFPLLSPSMSAGEFKTGQIPSFKGALFKHGFVWANSGRGQTVCKSRRAKIIRRENYSVNSKYINLFKDFLCCKKKEIKIQMI